MSMVIGLLTLELQIPESGSLKQKRQVIRSVVDKIRQRLNVSVAEVDHQDSWQLATLAIACVATDAAGAQQMMQSAVNLIETRRFDLVLLDYQTELL